MKTAPRGTRVRFAKPASDHWFTNVVEDQKLLKVGGTYTVEKVEVASSGTYLWLKEFPPHDEDGRLPFFNYHSFEILNEN